MSSTNNPQSLAGPSTQNFPGGGEMKPNWPLPTYQSPEEFQMNNILHDISHQLDDRPAKQPEIPMSFFKPRVDFVRRHLCWFLVGLILLAVTLASVIAVAIIAGQKSHPPTPAEVNVTILETLISIQSTIASTTFSFTLSSTVTRTQPTTLVTTQSTTESTTLSATLLSTITQVSIATTVIEGQTIVQQNTVTAVIVVTQSVIECVLFVEPSAAHQLKTISRPPGTTVTQHTTLSTTSVITTQATQ